jgi:hypothetical protein
MRYNRVVKQLKKIKEVLLKYPNKNPDYVKTLLIEIDLKLQEIEEFRKIEMELIEDQLDTDYLKDLA